MTPISLPRTGRNGFGGDGIRSPSRRWQIFHRLIKKIRRDVACSHARTRSHEKATFGDGRRREKGSKWDRTSGYPIALGKEKTIEAFLCGWLVAFDLFTPVPAKERRSDGAI